MHRARDRALQEISPADLGTGTHAQRVFGEVVHVQVHGNGFISGVARAGRTNIVFDSYSFQNASDGLHLGPFFLSKYDAAEAPLRKRGLFSGGRARGTMLYGTVIQPTPGKHRFLDAVASDELHFFWSTLQYGREFVHANWKRYFAGGTDKSCGELFAAACLLVGDAHTLAGAQCMPAETTHALTLPVSNKPSVRLRQDAVSFVLLLSLLCHSAEPYRLFAQVAKVYAVPAVVQRLRFPCPCTPEVAEALVADDCTVDFSAVPEGTVFHDLEPGHVRQAALAIARGASMRPALPMAAVEAGATTQASTGKCPEVPFVAYVDYVDDDGDAESVGSLSDEEPGEGEGRGEGEDGGEGPQDGVGTRRQRGVGLGQGPASGNAGTRWRPVVF